MNLEFGEVVPPETYWEHQTNKAVVEYYQSARLVYSFFTLVFCLRLFRVVYQYSYGEDRFNLLVFKNIQSIDLMKLF